MYRDREGKPRRTKTWFIKYYVKGKPRYLSSNSESYDEALALLRQKVATVGRNLGAHASEPERVRMNQLFDLLIDDYVFKERRSLHDAKLRVDRHLREHFGASKAQDITTTAIRKYVEFRKRARRARPENATINKELALLRRALKLGEQHHPPLVLRVPHFDMLPLDNVRTGVVGHDDYRTLRDLLPPHARIALVIAYHTGARKGEIQKICRDQIDLAGARIVLPARSTKNRSLRYLPIYGDMQAELDMALAAGETKCPFLIQHNGEPVLDWKKSWKAACTQASLEATLFHDLRRTALTNMIEAGFSEKEAMEISGHKTRAVFDRYHIVSEKRLKMLAGKLEEYMRAKENVAETARQKGQNTH